MFNGIINNIANLVLIKYFFFNNYFCFFFLKINHLNKLNLNLGFSFSVQGICLTLIYKNFIFFEFEISFETLYIETFFFKLINIENSFCFCNNLDGSFLLGHVNSKIVIKYIYIYINFLKFCLIIEKKTEKFIFYKYSIFINGINLTINEIYLFKKKYFCIKIINFTFNITNFKFLKLFDILNIEFDFTIFFILNFLYLKCF